MINTLNSQYDIVDVTPFLDFADPVSTVIGTVIVFVQDYVVGGTSQTYFAGDYVGHYVAS